MRILPAFFHFNSMNSPCFFQFFNSFYLGAKGDYTLMFPGLVFADSKPIVWTYCSWEKLRPKTYAGWFLARFNLRKYDVCLRYHVITRASAFRSWKKSYTFNSAAARIIEILATYPKDTLVGLSWSMYGAGPLSENKYKSVFDLRDVAVSVLIGTRDFYTDKTIERIEQGDESLDTVHILIPLGLATSDLKKYK